MPRVVRNCWVDVKISGRATTLSSGPRMSNGRMYLTVSVREKGKISDKKLRVEILPTPSETQLRVKVEWADKMVVNELLDR